MVKRRSSSLNTDCPKIVAKLRKLEINNRLQIFHSGSDESDSIDLTIVHGKINDSNNPLRINEDFSMTRFKVFSIKFMIYDYSSDKLDLIRNASKYDFALIITSDAKWFLYCQQKDQNDMFQFFPLNTDAEFNYSNYKAFCRSFHQNLAYQIEGELSESNSTKNCPYLWVKIYVMRSIIIDNNESWQKSLSFQNNHNIKIMSFLKNIPAYNSKTQHEFKTHDEIDEFYELIHKKQQDYENSYDIKSIKLDGYNSNTERLEYQCKAIAWMNMRENSNLDFDLISRLFIELFDGNTLLFYYLPLGHFVTPRIYHEYLKELSRLKNHGGILADKMGLGKTVETIGLILTNRRKTNDSSPIHQIPNQDCLYLHTTDPLYGQVQCLCGENNHEIIEDISVEELLRQSFKQKYFIKGNLIKCLLCANYQHVACSKYNPVNNEFPYYCSYCWQKIPQIDSPASLIVCPKSILVQWIGELKKHVKEEIKIYHYQGLRCNDYCQPFKLAQNDIVITTYEILRTEIDYVSPLSRIDSSRRKIKKYHPPISPLLSIKWWRLVYDEAQLVEGQPTKTFKMAEKLSAVNRWAVTGTPILKNINDLYGLLCFIQEVPFCWDSVWKNVIYSNSCEGNHNFLIDIISKCFWRNNEHYTNIIPKPICITKSLELSQVERDYYLDIARRTRELVSEKSNRDLSNEKIGESTIAIKKIIAKGTLKLRKNCCYLYQIFRHASQECSVEEIFDKILENAVNDIIKCHRELIANINAIAAVFISQNDINSAIKYYLKALVSSDSLTDEIERFKADKTQLYHVYHNLAYSLRILKEDRIPVETILSEDERNRDRCKKNKSIEKFYLQILNDIKSLDENKLQNSYEYFISKAEDVRDKYLSSSQNSFETLNKSKYHAIIKSEAKYLEIDDSIGFLPKLMQNLSTQMKNHEIINMIKMKINFDFERIESLKFFLTNFLHKILAHHVKLIEIFENINYDSIFANSSEYIRCHIQFENILKDCLLCKVDRMLSLAEIYLFQNHYVSNLLKLLDLNDNEIRSFTVVNFNDSNAIIVFRQIVRFLDKEILLSHDHHALMKQFKAALKFFELFQDELKLYRKIWIESITLIQKIDELDQARSRITYDRAEIDFQRSLNLTKYRDAKTSLKNFLGRLDYLNNLKKTFDDDKDQSAKICTICYDRLSCYAIFFCGHIVCSDCHDRLKLRCKKTNNFNCPNCRYDLKFSDTKLVRDVHQKKIDVKGQWSTKIQNIVHQVNKIVLEDSSDKILIFSSWIDFLEKIETALQQNSIKTLLLKGSDRNFDCKILQFKNSTNISVLLLPLRFAGKGFNLTEASHLIIAETIVDKNTELQAIGRISRIGQKKKPYIYKFPVSNTIEEFIENLNKQKTQVISKQRSSIDSDFIRYLGISQISVNQFLMDISLDD